MYRPQSSKPSSTLRNGPTSPWSKSNSPSLHQNQGISLGPFGWVVETSISPMLTRQIADSCVLWTGFDISIVARNYAQFAGVLAGFAFVVINLALDRGYRRRGHDEHRAARAGQHERLA